jgi:hypothetical protein
MRQGLNGEEVLDEDRVVEVDADEAVQHASDDGETELLIAGATARPPRTRSIEDTSDAGAMSSTEATISEVTDGEIYNMMCYKAAMRVFILMMHTTTQNARTGMTHS